MGRNRAGLLSMRVHATKMYLHCKSLTVNILGQQNINRVSEKCDYYDRIEIVE